MGAQKTCLCCDYSSATWKRIEEDKLRPVDLVESHVTIRWEIVNMRFKQIVKRTVSAASEQTQVAYRRMTELANELEPHRQTDQ